MAWALFARATQLGGLHAVRRSQHCHDLKVTSCVPAVTPATPASGWWGRPATTSKPLHVTPSEIGTPPLWLPANVSCFSLLRDWIKDKQELLRGALENEDVLVRSRADVRTKAAKASRNGYFYRGRKVAPTISGKCLSALIYPCINITTPYYGEWWHFRTIFANLFLQLMWRWAKKIAWPEPGQGLKLPRGRSLHGLRF